MTGELALRLGVVMAAVLAALVFAVAARRGRSVRRYKITLRGIGPGLFFFSSVTCATCDRMRERLADFPDVAEISYEGEGFPVEVRRVPAVALLDADGRGWIAYGDVSSARLGRWIAAGP